MITTYLKENNLIVCPNSYVKSIVKEMNDIPAFVSYKIMDLHQFLENYFFSYDKKTIFYLMKKLNVRYEIVLEYLESMFFIEDIEYKSLKLKELKKLKKELIEKKLLYFHPGFRNILKRTNLIVCGYDFLDPFYQKIMKKFSNYNHIRTENISKKHTIYAFHDIEEEIAFVCHDIKNKLDSGIPIRNIKLLSPGNEYTLPLKRIFDWCHIPIEKIEKTTLYDTMIGKEVLKMIDSNFSFATILDILREHELDYDILNSILSIFNQYVDFKEETKELFDMIEYDLKHTYLATSKTTNCITICDWNQITEKDIIYILGFNKENYPTMYKDTSFLSDSMRQELGLFDSNSKNMHSMITLKEKLNQPFKFIITYKKRTAFDTYNPSILIEEEAYEVINNPTISYQISHLYNQIMLAKKYDWYYKYGLNDETIKILKYNYPKLNYRTYQNTFTKLNREKFIQTLNRPFILSYSTIDEYYHCAFRYYISSILKIREENTDDFYIHIGNIFHAILSKCFDRNFDFQKEWNFEIGKYCFPFNKKIFLEKLKQELEYDIKILHKQLNYSNFFESLYEKRLIIPIANKENIPVHFVGVVDKISYLQEKERTLVSIIDYKTGKLPIELNHMIYGIGMQLPIYLYLIKRSNLFQNVEIVGFYLQKIINQEKKRTLGKNIEELKENSLKLVGYSLDQEEILKKFDMTYQDSKLISGLKKKKEGFYAYSKVLSSKQLNEIDNLVSNKVEEAANKILEGSFPINPKRIDKKNVGCEYCGYRDLCYRSEKDYVELEAHHNLDFLRGEIDA